MKRQVKGQHKNELWERLKGVKCWKKRWILNVVNSELEKEMKLISTKVRKSS